MIHFRHRDATRANAIGLGAMTGIHPAKRDAYSALQDEKLPEFLKRRIMVVRPARHRAFAA